MPALVIIYAVIGWFIFRAKTEHGRKVASITMLVLSLFLLVLAWIGPAPGLLQD